MSTRMRIVTVWVLLLLLCGSVQAQSLSVGLSAGAPLNPLMTSAEGQTAATQPYTFGPALRVDLPHGLGVDLEVLYKRFRLGFVADPARATVHRLEFPVMLRYRLSRLPARPFVHAGMSFNRIVAVSGANACGQGAFDETAYCIGGRFAAELRHRHTRGIVLGGGLNFRWRQLRLAPELRVTRWVDRNFGTKDTYPHSNLTGVELLLGIGF